MLVELLTCLLLGTTTVVAAVVATAVPIAVLHQVRPVSDGRWYRQPVRAAGPVREVHTLTCCLAALPSSLTGVGMGSWHRGQDVRCRAAYVFGGRDERCP